MRHHKKILGVALALGIIDSVYLTIVHFAPGALYCPTIGTTVNCESVLGSSLSAVFGIPIAVLGLVWFVAAFLFLLFGHNKIVKNVWMLFGAGGILYSIVGQTIIGKICIYCSLLDIFLALSIGMFLYL
ncbi:MAG: vitamin K epoxide reductase family protein [Candidatus Micrarchaeaceae archaeon]|jgi:uncharacterized membrane protein|nr:hypothetical protein [Candidatus Micrarchaeota archaeon]HII09619.1 hypothetical protein [Candidatus Micrarchaeota archaeon]